MKEYPNVMCGEFISKSPSTSVSIDDEKAAYEMTDYLIKQNKKRIAFVGLADDFKFDYVVPEWDLETVHVWRSINPVNNLIYGYGGVKLLPRKLTINMDTSKTDMTTSISTLFKPMTEISNVTAFNTDPFNTWKSAFRECVKLASKTIDRQDDIETQLRLEAWCTLNESAPYGKYAHLGAIAGKYFGLFWQNAPSELAKINDFEWLHEQFSKHSL
jgi:hypothetical protein